MGFEAKATIPIMTAIGDAVAGLGGGKDLINRITLALGEMNEAGTVSKREMNMLTKAGIDAWGSLAAAIGKSVPEAMDMVHKKMIDSATAIPAILEGIEERMGGMMQNQMRTIAGQWSNLQDQISFILADIGKALAPFAGMVMDAAAPVLRFIKDITEGFKNLPEGIQAAIVTLGALATAVGPAMLAFAGFSLAVAKVGELLGVAGLGGIIAELAPILIPLAAAILAAGLAWEAWKLEPVQNAVKSVWDTLQNFWTSTLQPVVETVMAAGVAFATFAGNIIGSGLQAAWEGLQSIGQTLMTVVSSLADALAPLWAAFTNVLDSLSPLLQPIEDLIGFLGKMIVALVEAGLIVGWEALKVVLGAVWEATSALATLIGGSFMTILGGMANMVKEVSQVWDALFKPALQAAVDALRAFLGVVAQIPGIKQAIDGVNSLFGEMKEKVVGAVEGARESVKGWGEDTRTSMAKAKEALDAAQKAYADVTEKAKEGKASQEQIKTATENLARAQSDYRAELERVKPRQEELTRAFHAAQAEYDASEANLRKVQKAFEDGKASAGDLASAQTRVNDASVGLKKAQSDLNDITKQTGVTMKDYSGSVDSVRASLQAHNQHAQTAKEAQAALKAEVETARQAFVKAFESYRTGTADVAAVQAAYENLQNAQDNLHPEKAAEAFIKAREDERKKSEENLAWYETTYLPKIAQMAEQEQQQILKIQETYFKAYQAMQGKAKEQIVIDVKLTDRLPEEVQAIKEFTDAVAQAYKDLGITSTQAIENHAEKARIAYETIRDSGIASERDILEAKKKYYEAEIQAAQAAGEKVTDAQKKALDDIKIALGQKASDMQKIWDGFVNNVKGILKGFQRDFVGGIWDSIFGNNNNADLDKQADELKTSLAQRTQEWQAYQESIAGQIDAITQKHQQNLAQELADLQAQLDQKTADWNQYQQDIASQFSDFVTKNDSALRQTLADLNANLNDKRQAYDQYVADANEKLSTIYETSAEKLAEELSNLREAFDKKKQAYDEYVQDVQTKLRRLNEDFTDNVNDQTESVNRGIADKQLAYQRDAEDTATKIARELAKGKDANLQNIEDWKKTLDRKKQDLETYTQRAKADLAEYTEEHKTALDRQIADINEASARKAAQLEQDRKDSQDAQAKAIKDTNDYLAAQQKTIADGLAKQTATYNAYYASVQQKMVEAQQKHDQDLDKERQKLAKALADKQVEYDKYLVAIDQKMAAARIKEAQAQAKELADLAAELAAKQAEYEKYVQEVNAKLQELANKHVTFWDTLGESAKRALQSIAEAITNFGLDALIEKIKESGFFDGIKQAFSVVFDDITEGLVTAFKAIGGTLKTVFGGFGETLVGVFKDAWEAIKTIAETIWDAVKAIGHGIAGLFNGAGGAASAVGSAAGGAASSAGSAAAGIASGVTGVIGAVTGVVSAVTGVISVIQGMHQSADLGRIEENTRFAQIGIVGTGGLVQMADAYWPKLEGFENFNFNVMKPVLGDISDGVTGKGDKIYEALVVNVTNVLIDIKNFFHDLIFDVLDTNTALGDIHLMLTTISGSLDEIKLSIANMAQSAMQSAQADQAVAGSISRQEISLNSISGGLLNIGPSISAAIQSIDMRASMQQAISNLGTTVSNVLTGLDLRSTVSGAFNNLSASFSGLSSAVISASSMRTTMPTSNVYLTVNNQAPAMTSNLAALLRSYGVTI